MLILAEVWKVFVRYQLSSITYRSVRCASPAASWSEGVPPLRWLWTNTWMKDEVNLRLQWSSQGTLSKECEASRRISSIYRASCLEQSTLTILQQILRKTPKYYLFKYLLRRRAKNLMYFSGEMLLKTYQYDVVLTFISLWGKKNSELNQRCWLGHK